MRDIFSTRSKEKFFHHSTKRKDSIRSKEIISTHGEEKNLFVKEGEFIKLYILIRQ